VPDVCALSQINIVVSDMPRTLAFYRRFGWSIDTPTEDHAVAHLAPG
jgi:catechol 2,3-dioxygenase-like lactoylglutathione lyase family enzyme